MENLKNVLKSVNTFGLLALMVVAFATMAFKTSENGRTIKKWSFDPTAPVGTQYQDVTHLQESNGQTIFDYRCELSDNVCTAEYDAAIDPNTNPMATPLNVVNGNFILEYN